MAELDSDPVKEIEETPTRTLIYHPMAIREFKFRLDSRVGHAIDRVREGAGMVPLLSLQLIYSSIEGDIVAIKTPSANLKVENSSARFFLHRERERVIVGLTKRKTS